FSVRGSVTWHPRIRIASIGAAPESLAASGGRGATASGAKRSRPISAEVMRATSVDGSAPPFVFKGGNFGSQAMPVKARAPVRTGRMVRRNMRELREDTVGDSGGNLLPTPSASEGRGTSLARASGWCFADPLEEEHNLFVQEFPDAIEEGVAHRVFAAAD